MPQESAIRLEREGAQIASTFQDVNAALAGHGIAAWPVDLSGLPPEIRRLLVKLTLTEAENRQLKAHFLLSRERLLEVIDEAGRKPNLPGGGALDSYCIETKTHYPQLHVIAADHDYSGFFPFHANLGEDGTGADEVGHVLSGSNMQYRFRLADGAVVVLSLSCATPDQAWRFTFNGTTPHGGILKDTAVGTKVLVQAIGPERFHLRYVE